MEKSFLSQKVEITTRHKTASVRQRPNTLRHLLSGAIRFDML